MTFKVTDNQ